MQTAIEFRNIRKAYGEHVVLDGFDLKIAKGELVTIIGSSGCGKTTALKMVNGLIEPTSGDILVNGENIRDKDHALRRTAPTHQHCTCHSQKPAYTDSG